MYSPTKHCGEGDNFLRFPVFPTRDANISEIKDQFGYTALYVLAQILNYSLEKRSRYLRALPFLLAILFWITSSECRRTKEFIHSRVDLILN
jgi:hypothetical protein